MKIKVHFSKQEENLIRDGYKEKHRHDLDETNHILQYDLIPEYIQLGKKVKRRHAISSFINEWAGVIFWLIVIAGFITWTIHNSNQSNYPPNHQSNSSTSRIYESETCPVTTCNDGACSNSTGRGTCSYHDGVRE